MTIEIIEGQFYTTASGKRVKVTSHYDHSDEIFGLVYNDDGTLADFFKASYNQFCNALKE